MHDSHEFATIDGLITPPTETTTTVDAAFTTTTATNSGPKHQHFGL